MAIYVDDNDDYDDEDDNGNNDDDEDEKGRIKSDGKLFPFWVISKICDHLPTFFAVSSDCPDSKCNLVKRIVRDWKTHEFCPKE